MNYEEEDQSQDEYVFSTELLRRSNTEKRDTLKSDNISVQEMYIWKSVILNNVKLLLEVYTYSRAIDLN